VGVTVGTYIEVECDTCDRVDTYAAPDDAFEAAHADGWTFEPVNAEDRVMKATCPNDAFEGSVNEITGQSRFLDEPTEDNG